jgi:hypothetical protein
MAGKTVGVPHQSDDDDEPHSTDADGEEDDRIFRRMFCT